MITTTTTITPTTQATLNCLRQRDQWGLNSPSRSMVYLQYVAVALSCSLSASSTKAMVYLQYVAVALSCSLSASNAKAAVDVAYRIFTDETGYPAEARRAAGERVCLPLLRSCDLAALREFFLDHIGQIMQVLEANLSKVSCQCPW